MGGMSEKPDSRAVGVIGEHNITEMRLRECIEHRAVKVIYHHQIF
jgi:hypothetical protein